jgi:signal transduction histidine kinase/CheY-like chemotaxis protein
MRVVDDCPEGMKIVHEQGKIIKDESGRLKRMLGIFRDVTEEKKLRQESEYRLQQVIQADKLASLGEVVAGVAHEINNPNSFISYNVPLLEETWQMLLPIINEFAASNTEWCAGNMGIDELRKDMADIIQAIKTGSDRIKKVVSNLKEFARLDDSAQMKPVQINEVLENTLTIVGARLRKAVRKVNIDLAKDLPQIPGHFQKLEQVTANLVLNAANAISDKDQGLVNIYTRFLNWANAVIVEVEDNGKGMPREVVSRIFDPFFTTRRESGGTGLGLSVTYGLVQEHNGVISVLSHPSIGSKFTVYLPINSNKKLELRPAILCVDDDPQILRLLHTFFMSVKNVSLDTLQNPEEVLDYLQAHPEVDIVLSDIWMPNLDGWQLYKQIKNKFPLLSVMLYSGDPEAINRKPPDIAAPEYFFKKPLSFKQLMGTVNAIGRQRLWK